MPKKQKINLNLFGMWIDTLATILHVTWTEMARRAGINDSTIPQLAHTPDLKRPARPTVDGLWRSIQAIAAEKKVFLPESIEMGFINATDHSTDIQKDISGTILNVLRSQHGMNASNIAQGDISGAILEIYRIELKRQEERIAELERELRNRQH